MGNDNQNLFNFDTNYDGMYQNDKPNVGTIDECSDDYPIKKCYKYIVEVLNGELEFTEMTPCILDVQVGQQINKNVCHACMYHGNCCV